MSCNFRPGLLFALGDLGLISLDSVNYSCTDRLW